MDFLLSHAWTCSDPTATLIETARSHSHLRGVQNHLIQELWFVYLDFFCFRILNVSVITTFRMQYDFGCHTNENIYLVFLRCTCLEGKAVHRDIEKYLPFTV